MPHGTFVPAKLIIQGQSEMHLLIGLREFAINPFKAPASLIKILLTGLHRFY